MISKDPDLDIAREHWQPLVPSTALRTRTLAAYDRELSPRFILRPLVAIAALVVLMIGAFTADERRPRPEQVTEFYPLIYAPPPLYNGTLVRVTVSAATMQIAGLPVREDQLNQNIQADLLLGDDGTPRAIRFVGINNER
jgi:hypothetical protein